MQHNIAWALAMCKLTGVPDDERAVECYNALSACDQLDIDRQVASIIVGVKSNEIKNQIDKVEKKKEIKENIIWITVSVISVVLICWVGYFLCTESIIENIIWIIVAVISFVLIWCVGFFPEY